MVEGSLGIAKVCACSDSLLAVDHPSTSVIGEEMSAVARAMEGVIWPFVVAVPTIIPNKTTVECGVCSRRDGCIRIPERDSAAG